MRAETMQYTVQQSLRLRVSPSTKAAMLAQMPVGAVLTTVTDQQVSAEGYVWVNVQFGGNQGWAALTTIPEIYLVAMPDPGMVQPPITPQPQPPANQQPVRPSQPPPTVIPQPPPSLITTSKIGLHIMAGSDAPGIWGRWSIFSAPGGRWAVYSCWLRRTITSAYSRSTMSAPRRRLCCAATNLIRDQLGYARFAAAGEGYMDRYYRAHLAGNTDFLAANFHQILNELPRDNALYTTGVTSWWMGALDTAELYKIKLAALCFTTGQPPLPGDDCPTLISGSAPTR